MKRVADKKTAREQLLTFSASVNAALIDAMRAASERRVSNSKASLVDSERRKEERIRSEVDRIGWPKDVGILSRFSFN